MCSQKTQTSLHIHTVWSDFLCPSEETLILGNPKCAQWRFWWDTANAQADLSTYVQRYVFWHWCSNVLIKYKIYNCWHQISKQDQNYSKCNHASRKSENSKKKFRSTCTYLQCQVFVNHNMQTLYCLTHFSPETPKNGNWLTVQIQIRCRILWHLIRIYIVLNTGIDEKCSSNKNLTRHPAIGNRPV